MALGGVAREVGAEGDYEQALTAQKTRQDLAELYARSLDDPTLSNVIVLRPGDARLNGAVIFDRASGDLANWRTVGSVATWNVQKTTPGKYNVIVTYSVAPMGDPPARVNIYSPAEDLTTGGDFEFYEDSSLSGASMNRRAGQVTDTGGWDKPASLQLAPITLSRSSATFALKITRTRGSGGVMRVKEIRLSPAKEGDTSPLATTDPVPTVDGSPAPAIATDEVTTLRDAHKTRLQGIIRPYVEAYSLKVAKLAEHAQAKNDVETANDLLQETQTVQKLVDNPSRVSVGSSTVTATASLQGQGYKEWLDVKYVSSVNNTGDSFLVTYQGETIPVRLLWVTCPPAAPEATAEIKACGAYFGLTAEDVTILGKQARVFTDTFLQDKPLKILSRGLKDDQGRVLAVVQPEGVGDFAGVLVDNGLACVNAPASRARNPKRFEEMTLSSLKERESLAKARLIPPGAWAMQPDRDPVTSTTDGASGSSTVTSATPNTGKNN